MRYVYSSSEEYVKFGTLLVCGIIVLLIASSGAVAADDTKCEEVEFGDENTPSVNYQNVTTEQQSCTDNYRNHAETTSIDETAWGFETEDSAEDGPTVGDDADERDPAGISVVVDPTTTKVVPGETVTFDLVVEDADQGVGAYKIALSSADSAVTFEEVSLRNDPTFPGTEISENGTHLNLEVGMGDNKHPGANETVLAEVTAAVNDEITPDANATIRTENAEVTNIDGNRYNISDSGSATLSIVEPTGIFEIDPVEDRTVTSQELTNVSFGASVTNAGNWNDTKQTTLQIGGEAVTTKNVSIDTGETTTVTFEGVTLNRTPGTYNYTILTEDDEQSGTLEVVEGLDPVGGGERPQDLDGDGLYEDIDGDGDFTVFDVQAVYDNLDTEAVQGHPEAFNFSGSDNPEEVTIFDVQALFDQLTV